MTQETRESVDSWIKKWGPIFGVMLIAGATSGKTLQQLSEMDRRLEKIEEHIAEDDRKRQEFVSGPWTEVLGTLREMRAEMRTYHRSDSR